LSGKGDSDAAGAVRIEGNSCHLKDRSLRSLWLQLTLIASSSKTVGSSKGDSAGS
jgi:hypothetical protein